MPPETPCFDSPILYVNFTKTYTISKSYQYASPLVMSSVLQIKPMCF